ncbi:MAG: hypothetical protein ACFE8G_03720 [Candidatus Hermodarchaeota archaeon]
MKERTWLDENILMLNVSPKEYYKSIFKEIVEEIKHNHSSLKKKGNNRILDSPRKAFNRQKDI